MLRAWNWKSIDRLCNSVKRDFRQTNLDELCSRKLTYCSFQLPIFDHLLHQNQEDSVYLWPQQTLYHATAAAQTNSERGLILHQTLSKKTSKPQNNNKTQNQAPPTRNWTSILLQSKIYLGSKNGKVLRDENKQPLLSVFLAFLFHIMTKTEQNFLRDNRWNRALSTTTLGARDLDKER